MVVTEGGWLFDEKHGRGPLTLHRVRLDTLLWALGGFERPRRPSWTRGAGGAVWNLLAARRGRPVPQLALRHAIMPLNTDARRSGAPVKRETLYVVISQLRRQKGEPILRAAGGYMLAPRP